MKIKRLVYTIIIAAISVAIISCSSSRNTGKLSPEVKYPVSVASLAEALAEKGDWQTMKIPVNVKLKKPLSAKIGGTMTLVRGSEVRLSLRFFGMEVASASITNDSVRAYVKVQKVYLAESLDQALGGFPATMDNLQSLLLARIFEVGKTYPDLGHCKIFAEDGGNSYTVTPPSVAAGLSYTFTADIADNHLADLDIVSSGNHKANVTYSYPRNSEYGIPEQIALLGSLKGKPLEAEIEYSVSGIDRSASSPKAFEIPRGYRKVSSSSLLKLLDSLK